MLPRCLHAPQVLVLFAFIASLAHGQQVQTAQAAPVLVADGLGKGTVALDGQWQFHLGDDQAWAAPGFDDSHWEQLTADKPWGLQGHHSYAGPAWYRRHIHLSAGPIEPSSLAILLPAVEDSYEVYWNGRLAGTYGRVPPHPVWYLGLQPRTFGLGPARSGVLAVRVWKAPFISFDSGNQGGFYSPPLLGGPQGAGQALSALDYAWLRSQQFAFGLNSLYGLVAMLGLIAWLRDRSQWLIFWMVCFALTPPLNLMLHTLRLPIPFTFAMGIYQPIYTLADVSLWFLLLWLLDLRDDAKLVRLAYILAVVESTESILDGIATFYLAVPNPLPVQITDGILTGVLTVIEFFPFYLIAFAVMRRRHLDPARWLVALFAFLTQTIYVGGTALTQGSRFTHWTLGDKINAPLFTVLGNPINAQTLTGTLLLVAIVYAVYRFSSEERRRQSALEQEFRNARELQQVLIPDSQPSVPGFLLTSAYKPALEVGGDFFQIIPLEGASAGSTLIILGDVSGKGLKAAMAVSLIVGSIRTLAESASSPAEILAGLNRRLHGRLQGGFATAIALRLDSDGRCAIATAGHPAPFLNGLEIDLPGALPLGLGASTSYEQASILIAARDQLSLYTDGLLEARSPSGELFSFARLKNLFAASPTAAQAAEAAVQFGQDDDITVLTLTRLAAGEASSTLSTAPELVPARA